MSGDVYRIKKNYSYHHCASDLSRTVIFFEGITFEYINIDIQLRNSKYHLLIPLSQYLYHLVLLLNLIINWKVICHLTILTFLLLLFPPFLLLFNSLHSSTNQELFEKHLCNKSSHYEKYGQFLVTQRKPSRATTKLMLFIVSKDEWNTKEDTR